MAGYDPNQHPQGQGGQQYPNQQDPNQMYYDPNDPNAPQEEFSEEDAYYSDEDGQVAKSLPWMAIALVGHALALFIAVFIVTAVLDRVEIPPSAVSKNVPDQTPDVEPEEPEEPEVKEQDEVVEDATEVEQVEENTENQDQSDVVSPVKSPNPNIDDADSPSPNSGPNSNSGLAGGGGGGGGGPRGGGGGFGGRGGIRPKPQAERTNAALQWLADHQNKRGYWSPDKYHADSIRIQGVNKAAITRNVDFDSEVKKEEDVGLEHFTVGLTGLALLAFVGDGHTHEAGDFKGNVKRAAQYLLGLQDAEGCFGVREQDDYVYNHAICAMSFAELYAMTGTQMFHGPAQRAVDFIVKCQNPGLGWRYGIQPKENDSSVTAWMVLALKSAKIADLHFDSATVYEGANAWYDKVEGKSDDGYLMTGYHSPASGNARPGYREAWEQNAAMDACNAMVRLFTGKYKPGTRDVSALADRMMQDLPKWRTVEDGKESSLKVDYYYWYYGSLAAFQIGGNTWSKWEKELMQPILLEYQRGWHPKDRAAFPKEITNGAKSKGTQGRFLLDEHGSWDGLDPWCEHGGRVYATAINALTLEVYYRYARVGEK